MAVSAGVNWEFETGGSDANGGGFGGDVGTPQLTLADGACTAGSTTFTSATGGFTAGMVGSDVVITSGTNFIPGQYVITAQSNTNTVTLDHSPTYAGSGNGTGGNFTVSAGLDWATPGTTAAHATLTTASVVAATTTDITVKSTDYTVAVTDVGNVMFLTGGSATAGFYQIQSVTVGGDGVQTWRMDRAVGTAGQTCPGLMGGCRKLISSNSVMGSGNNGATSGNKHWIKSGSYTLATITGGTNSSTSNPIVCEGYNSVRGDLPSISSGNQPVLTGSTNFQPGQFTIYKNITFTTASANGFQLNADNQILNCKFTSTNATSTNSALTMTSANMIAFACEVVNASGRAINITGTGLIDSCYVHGSNTGIRANTQNCTIINNLITGCTNAFILSTSAFRSYFINNTLFGAETPAGTGISDGGSGTEYGWVIRNNIIYGFTTGATWSTNVRENITWDHNNFFNNTTDRVNINLSKTDIALNPNFTNTAGNDFSVGTNMKAAAYPGVFPGLTTTTGYLDIGAVQRQEPTGGGFAPTVME